MRRQCKKYGKVTFAILGRRDMAKRSAKDQRCFYGQEDAERAYLARQDGPDAILGVPHAGA